MFSLRIDNHEVKPGVKMFEIWNEGKFMGTIYPTEKGIKVVSKYIMKDPESVMEIDRSKWPWPPIPAILINLIK